MNLPTTVTRFQRRARYPSITSVIAATVNTTAARKE